MREPRFVNVQPSLFDDWDQLKENAKSLADIVAEQDDAAYNDIWLAQSHQLQLLLNTMREAVLYFDSQGCLKLANNSAQQWLLKSPHTGARLSELFSQWPDAHKQQEEIFQVVRRGTNTWGSKSALVLGELTYWVSIDKIATTDLGGQVNGVMAVFTDITDTVLKEKALQEGEMRYRAYMSHSNDGIWCYELLAPVDIHLSIDEQAQQIAKQARLAECNERFAQMYGFDSVQ
ncbi:MAG TPA: PAS domain-containing protein, partial [Cellvibrionaceae bacterium]|nr:PAS domain-containing protein [Cellvibrionaceae bacterium]